MNHLSENSTELVLLVFLAIVFLQSALDKIIDWKGNLGWLKEHFSKSIFKGAVPILLGVLALMESVTGLLALPGIVHLAWHDNGLFAFYAAVFACITLLSLLLGQRITKDYDGAKTIVIYLIPAVFLLYLLQ